MDKNDEKKEEVTTQPVQPATAAAAKQSSHAQLEKQLADYKDSLQRLQAEFENYKKRVDREKLQSKEFAAAEVARAFLPVLDSFELALKSVNSCKKEAADDKVAKGLEMIYGQFYSALESKGLRSIKAIGEKLDPYRHEVLLQEETTDEKMNGIVVEEFQKGYMLNDIVLRYSKVKVLKLAKKEGQNEN